MSTHTEIFWESTVAERLGISRTRMRELRKYHLTQETDWRMDGNAVVLTAAGLAKIESALVSAPVATETPTAPEKAAGEARGVAAVPSGPPPSRKFMVWRIPPNRIDSPQRKVLICREVSAAAVQVAPWGLARVQGSGAERPVRVRDNGNFIPGMVLDAVNIGHGMWQYVGRLPRRQGKW
jgi:hypothetical protein